ncbi:MAG TPA: DNA-binding protein [Rhodopirellula baltica]|nr:DNA-binding protein [Rhodopirellula baltica]
MNTSQTVASAIQDGKRRAMMSVDDVANELGCSSRHVRRLIDRGKLPRPIRLGSLVRILRADFDHWLNAGCPNLGSASRGRRS